MSVLRPVSNEPADRQLYKAATDKRVKMAMSMMVDLLVRMILDANKKIMLIALSKFRRFH